MSLNGGYAMIKYNSTQEELQIAYRSKKPALFYDENQRAHWAVIEETATESVDEETQEHITIYKYSYRLLDDVGGGSEVHLYEHKLTIIGYENLYCYMHPIYLSTEVAITKDNISSNLIGYNYSNNNSNICHTTENNRIEIGNLGSILIMGATDTVTKIF